MVKGDTGGYFTFSWIRELRARAGDIDCHGVGKTMRIDSVNISPQTLGHGARRLRAVLLLSVLSSLGAACGGSPAPGPVAPAAPPVSAPSGTTTALAIPPPAADPFAAPASPRDEDAATAPEEPPLDLEPWKRAKTAKGVSAPPPSCAAYANRAPGKEHTGLIEAFAEKDPAKRDARLVAISKTAAMLAGAWTLMIRAELAPIECADAIIDPFLQAYSPASSTETPSRLQTLVGFSLAAKLSRTATAPPAMGAIRDKEKVKAFIGGPLKTWLVEQSTAIEVLSSGAAGLTGYARGVAAIEAGIAELRLVDKMRSAPVPATWDPELKAIYEAALDEALEPRKKRGRDAALVGMSDFAREGIFRDSRVDRARTLLSKLYGGRRIDALDGLLVPVVVVTPPMTTKELAIANVPSTWLENPEIINPEEPRILTRGVTRQMRKRFATNPDSAAPEVRSAYARTRFDMGRVYWRRVDFVEAAHGAKGSKKPEDRLTLALSLALAQGPNGAAEMMRAPTPAALDLRHTEALEALAAEGGPLAGLAAYDAAHLRALSPP
ncbi:MAG: hypothetical protein JWP87_5238, partial [Labilithrix sp.]|nr:hypothetical protein [Labilithrix sp.]